MFLWKLQCKKMAQSGNLLLKLKREMMNYSRKLAIVNTGSTYFKTQSRSFKWMQYQGYLLL
uniref:Uncharacterized protein n=1 Tax=Arundo donax TaxID=35708 RepID=A0A0A9CGU1_ARUDO